jgi:sulfide dehydrogenase cytochrome subunit
MFATNLGRAIMKQRITGLISLAGLFVALGAFFSTAATAADVNELVEDCQDCHGKDGASTEPKIPIIGGMSAQYIIDTSVAYKEEERPCIEAEYPGDEHKGEKTDMCKVFEKLSDEDVELVAEYFAEKPFVRAKQTADPEKAKTGEKIHDTQCKKCHEKGGSSPDDDAGILAGQWKHYLEQTFASYAEGKRSMPKKMVPKMEKLSEADTEALIHYYISFQ